jgi:hypothetical protein
MEFLTSVMASYFEDIRGTLDEKIVRVSGESEKCGRSICLDTQFR